MYFQNKLELALLDITKSIEIDPNNAIAINNRGFINGKLNKF
jgi:hypothetical protein